jgi:hypothetical protein
LNASSCFISYFDALFKLQKDMRHWSEDCIDDTSIAFLAPQHTVPQDTHSVQPAFTCEYLTCALTFAFSSFLLPALNNATRTGPHVFFFPVSVPAWRKTALAWRSLSQIYGIV